MSKPERIEGASAVDLRHAQSQWQSLHARFYQLGVGLIAYLTSHMYNIIMQCLGMDL